MSSESTDLASNYMEWAKRIARSLYQLNYRRGFGFVKRSHSGIWDLVEHDYDNANSDGKADSYRFKKHICSCNANAAAVIFLTLLMEAVTISSEEVGDENNEEIVHMAEECSANFLRQFFDTSVGRFCHQRLINDDDDDDDVDDKDAKDLLPSSYRAVDQAMGILACSRILKLLDRNNNGNAKRDRVQQQRYSETRTMATSAAQSLMDDFGYGMYATEGLRSPVNTIGGGGTQNIKNAATDNKKIVTTRNSWHDSIACFAILCSRTCSGGESPRGLCQFLARDYGFVVENSNNEESCVQQQQERQLLLGHNVLKETDMNQERNAYTCSQAIWNAVQRALIATESNDSKEQQQQQSIPGFSDFTVGLRAFQEKTASSIKDENGNDIGLLSTVGTTYPNIRLWANTETAAWLLMDEKDFRF